MSLGWRNTGEKVILRNSGFDAIFGNKMSRRELSKRTRTQSKGSADNKKPGEIPGNKKHLKRGMIGKGSNYTIGARENAKCQKANQKSLFRGTRQT